jgi:hypothetical protein
MLAQYVLITIKINVDSSPYKIYFDKHQSRQGGVMSFTEEVKLLKESTTGLSRGRIPSNIESKIRENVFDILLQLYGNVDTEKFLKTTELMYRDWSHEYSEDIRFGRVEESNKAIIKMSTFEWILSLPSVQKMRESSELS